MKNLLLCLSMLTLLGTSAHSLTFQNSTDTKMKMLLTIGKINKQKEMIEANTSWDIDLSKAIDEEKTAHGNEAFLIVHAYSKAQKSGCDLRYRLLDSTSEINKKRVILNTNDTRECPIIDLKTL